MMTNIAKVNLLDYDRDALKAFFLARGEKAYRAEQVLKWIHQDGVLDVMAMTNLSKNLRESLHTCCQQIVPEVVVDQLAEDGTRKFVLRLQDGNCIETVFIPEAERGTLCISSQVGCALNCSFCSTATQGFNRNLSVAEIIGQLWVVVRALGADAQGVNRRVSNIVMMGMGEPLLNLDNVVRAMHLMMDDFAYGLSKRRVTLSTSGVIPAMLELKERSDCALAVSLHAPIDELRNVLVPINKKYPIDELMAVCRDYFPQGSRRVVTFEYVMLDGVNDTPQHAKQLIRILQNVPCKMNLIPFNPFTGTQYKRSSQARIDQFRDILIAAGINTITRKTRGDEIDAACGQLVGKVADRTRRNQRFIKKLQQQQTQNAES